MAKAPINSYRVKTSFRGLDVVQAVYALAMAYGMTQVFVGSQVFITQILARDDAFSDAKTWVIIVLFANITMLGLRFFWVPRNLQDLVVTVKKLDPSRSLNDNGLSSAAIAVHMIMIFLHGALFYIICNEFEFIVFASTSSFPLSSSVFVGYVLMHILLLLINAGWIGVVKRQEERLSNSALVHVGESAGNVWWRNNLLSGLAAISLFAITSECYSGLACLPRPDSFTAAPAIFPTSPQAFASIYYAIAPAISYFIDAQLLPVFCVLIFFLINSMYDLMNAGEFYVTANDVEDEELVERAPDMSAR
ncbi:MAG: hypothetical protein AB7O79_05605 [Xanthobacteraceae bacterium]